MNSKFQMWFQTNAAIYSVLAEATGSKWSSVFQQTVGPMAIILARRCYAGDTRSRNLYQKVVWYQKLACLSVNLVQVLSGTSFLHAIEHNSMPAQKLSDT